MRYMVSLFFPFGLTGIASAQERELKIPCTQRRQVVGAFSRLLLRPKSPSLWGLFIVFSGSHPIHQSHPPSGRVGNAVTGEGKSSLIFNFEKHKRKPFLEP